MVVVCQPYPPAAFIPKKYSWYSFLLETESTPGPWCDRRDFMSMKSPLTPAGIEPAPYRFVAQHLNHCATAVPILYYIYLYYILTYSMDHLSLRSYNFIILQGILVFYRTGSFITVFGLHSVPNEFSTYSFALFTSDRFYFYSFVYT